MTRPERLRFECTRCGACCTNQGEYAHVYLGDREVDELALEKGLTVRAFEREYTSIDEYGWTQLRMNGDRCIFLAADGRCGVYAARPVQCRTFPFWRGLVDGGEWTDEAHGLCEGVGQGRLYSIEEVEAHMVHMEESDRD